MEADRLGEVVELPVPEQPSVTDIAIEELDLVHGYLFRRVGNRPDAEDLTQQVALKAIPHLKEGANRAMIRAYLFASARTELAGFWAQRFGLPVEELREELTPQPDDWEERAAGRTRSAALIDRILDRLPGRYAQVLRLRFLRGYSTKEAASELGMTVGALRVLQLRALRAAAEVARDA